MKCQKNIFQSENRGIALILTLTVLTLLMVIALGMTATQMYQEKGSKDFSTATLLNYAAEAGINRAVILLRKEAQKNYWDSRIESSEYPIGTIVGPWYYDSNPVTNPGNNPSFDLLDGVANTVSFSGNSGGATYDVRLEIYDCASRIYLNDMDNLRLSGILENLVSIIGAPLSAGDGTSLVIDRGINPYLTERDLQTRWSNYSPAKWNALSPYVTLYAYVDPTVVETYDEDVDGDIYERQARAPININTASMEVIASVLRGLTGLHICPNCSGDGRLGKYGWPDPPCPQCGGDGNIEITNAEADAIALWITQNRPFYSWAELYHDIFAALPGGIIPEDVDIILANCNPNPGIQIGTRDYTWGERVGFISKCQDIRTGSLGRPGLYNPTTEFCFNSGGWYFINSIASLNVAGKSAGMTNMSTYVKIFDQHVITTQKDFDTNVNKIGLVTYPEKTGYIEAGPRDVAREADGYIMRSFVSHILPDSGKHFRASLVGTLDAQHSGGQSLPVNETNISASNSILNKLNPSSLTNQGVLFSKQSHQELDYRLANNLSGYRGWVEFWYKPVTNRVDKHAYGRVAETTADRCLFKAWEQPNNERWTVENPATGFWAVKRLINRSSIQFWCWFDNGQHSALGSLGVSNAAGALGGGWYWMLLQSRGAAKSKYPVGATATIRKQLKKGEWMHCAFWYGDCVMPDTAAPPANDRGFTLIHADTPHYPDPDIGDIVSNPFWHWNQTGATRQNPEEIAKAGLQGRNLPNITGVWTGEAAVPSQNEKYHYFNGICNSVGTAWEPIRRGYVAMGPFPNDDTAIFSIGYNKEGWGGRHQFCDGIISGIRIWDESKFSGSVSKADMDTVIATDYLAGRYYDAGAEERLTTTAAKFTKDTNALWGCMHWTQYEPTYNDYSNNIDILSIPAQPNILVDVGDGINWLTNNNDPRSTILDTSVRLPKALLGGLSNTNNSFNFKIRYLNRAMPPVIDSTVFDEIRITTISDPVFANYQ